MSVTPINLNKVRKARARAARRAQADANAVTYGVSNADKSKGSADASRMARKLDGKVLETPPNGADGRTKKP